MKKTTNIIIIGFGSIGQRHYRNLLQLGYNNVYVYDIDGTKIKKYKNIKILGKIDINTLKQFDAAFICNPNNVHIAIAIKCAQAGCHLFIEKPLSHNLKNIDKLEQLCQKNKLITMVACDMRFHPSLIFIKNYLLKKKLGKIYSIHTEFGYYLPYWRPGQDYQKNYAAKRKTGGGIIIDDIHEFDLLFWLNNFAKVDKSNLIFDKVSDLKIQTEDSCIASFKFKNKVLGSVRCDYLQQSYTRSCKVVGAKGSLEWLEWDIKKNSVWLRTKHSNKKLFTIKKYDLNKPYIDEIKYFFRCLDNKQQTFNNIKMAKIVLKHCAEKI